MEVYLHTHVHSNSVHDSQKVETAQVSTDGQMAKEYVVYTYNASNIQLYKGMGFWYMLFF